MSHKDRPDSESNCYTTVQLWADGTVSAIKGCISTEGKGGQIYLHGLELSPEAARKAFEKAIKEAKKKGYVERQRSATSA